MGAERTIVLAGRVGAGLCRRLLAEHNEVLTERFPKSFLNEARRAARFVIDTEACQNACAEAERDACMAAGVTSKDAALSGVYIEPVGKGGVLGALMALSWLFTYNPVWWMCLVILVGGLVASSRMILRQHSLSQVVGGFLVGVVCAFFSVLYI